MIIDQSILDGLGLQDQLSTREWAERYRKVRGGPIADRHPRGLVDWRTSMTPHTAGIMDAVDDPAYDMVAVSGPTRAGKSEAAIVNPILRDLYRGWPVLYVNATREACVQFWQDKLLPAIEATPALADFQCGDKESGQMLHRIFPNRAILYMAGSGQVPAGFDAPRTYCDEVNKPGYRMKKGEEVSTLHLARERGSGYGRGRKLVLVCTVTTPEGEITRQFLQGDRRLYYVPCPFCGAYQVMEFREGHGSITDGKRFPDWEYPHGWLAYDDTSPVSARESARYVCGLCKAEISEEWKAWMVLAGVWIRQGCQVEVLESSGLGGFDRAIETCPLPARFIAREAGKPARDTLRASFHFNALVSRIVSWGDIASEWVDAAQNSDPDAQKSWQRSRLAIPWEDKDLLDKRAWDSSFVRAHSTPYHPRTLPGDCPAICATMGADVHAAAVYYVFRGWGADATSWLLEAGVISVHHSKGEDDAARLMAIENALDRLWEIFLDGFEVGTEQSPKHMAVSKGYLDEGWETQLVRASVSKQERRGLWTATKGIGGSKHHLRERQKEHPATLNIAVDRMKHILSRLMDKRRFTEAGGTVRVEPGYWHLHSQPGHDYVHHMCCEEWLPKKNKLGTDSEEWAWVPKNANNHWWDAEVLATAAALAMKIPVQMVGSGLAAAGRAAPAERDAGVGMIGEPRPVRAEDYGDRRRKPSGRGEGEGPSRGRSGWKIGR